MCVCTRVHVCRAGSRRGLLALSWDSAWEQELSRGARFPAPVSGAQRVSDTAVPVTGIVRQSPGVGTVSRIEVGETEEEVARPQRHGLPWEAGPCVLSSPTERTLCPCRPQRGLSPGLPPPHVHPLPQQEQERSEKASRRASAVEEVRSHVAALREMLGAHRGPGPAPPDQGALQVATRGRRGRGFRHVSVLTAVITIKTVHVSLAPGVLAGPGIPRSRSPRPQAAVGLRVLVRLYFLDSCQWAVAARALQGLAPLHQAGIIFEIP